MFQATTQPREAKLRRTVAALVSASLASTASAQFTKIPTANGDALDPVWGGDVTAIDTQVDGDQQKTVVGEDGGRIRYSLNTGSALNDWRYADTPDDISNTIMDLDFVSWKEGYACTRGGRILKTVDGGQTWSSWGSVVLDPCDSPALLWEIEPLSSTSMIAVGLWTAKITMDSGQSWVELNLHDVGANYTGAQILTSECHFYAVESVKSGSVTRVAISAQWEDAPDPFGPTGATTSSGIVLFTDTSQLGHVQGGSPTPHFRVTLNDIQYRFSNSVTAGDVMQEPWDLDFERGALPTTARGYVVGAAVDLSSSMGTVYITDDGGESWGNPQYTNKQLFAVSAEGYDGQHRAGIAAYGGLVFKLDATGTFVSSTVATPNALNSAPTLIVTAPFQAIDSAGPDHWVLGCGFGGCFATTQYMGIWQEANPLHNLDLDEFRLTDIHAVEDANGLPTTAYAVGQLGLIMKTTDAGASWDLQRWQYSPQNPPGTTYEQYLNDVEFWTASDGVAAGTNSSIVQTSDGGGTWQSATIHAGAPGNIIFNDVSLSGAGSGWAVGVRGTGGVLFSTVDLGQNWYEIPTTAAAPLNAVQGLTLEACTFPSFDQGLLVGWSEEPGGGTRARAFHVRLTSPSNPASAFITEVFIPHVPAAVGGTPPAGVNLAPHRKLLDVASAGLSLDTGRTIAVGNDGMVLYWISSGAAGFLVGIPGVFQINFLGGTPVFGTRMTTADLSSVDFASLQGHVLIGSEYDVENAKAADLGWALRYDGHVWSRIPQRAGKDAVSISLTSSNHGFMVGLATPNNGDAERVDGNACYFTTTDHPTEEVNVANLSNSVILGYAPN